MVVAIGGSPDSRAGGRRTPEDWIDAAYERFEDDGIDGIRVEALARDLATTKGSFYWHFADRSALIDAVMDRWESRETDRFIALAETVETPVERLRTLFSAVGRRRPGGEQRFYADAVAAGMGDRVERVTARRIGYIADALIELGVDAEEARRRGLAAVAVALGLEQLAMGGAGALFGGRETLAETVLSIIVPDERRGAAPQATRTT